MHFESSSLYDAALYRAANRLHLRAHPRQRVAVYAFVLAFPLLALGFSFMAVTAGQRAQDSESLLWWFGAAVMLFYSVLALVRRRFALRRRMREGLVGLNEEPRLAAVTDDEFINHLPGKARTAIAWQAFSDFTHDEDIALLYTAGERFFIVTRASADPLLWQEVCSFIQDKITTKGTGKC